MKRARDGGLWFGGPDFVVKLGQGRTELFERALNVQRLVERSDGTLWIAHEEGGLTRLQHGRFEPQPTAPVIFSALHEDAAGVLWAGSWGTGLFRLGPLGLVGAGGYGDGYVNDIESDASRTLWVASRAGLFAMKDGRTRRLLSASNVTAMGPSSDGGLWVGTRDGSLYRVGTDTSARLEPIGVRAPNQILAVFEDREGSVWIGHPDGLCRAKPGPFSSYGEQPWLARNPAMSILETADEAIWVFSDGGGLSRIKDGAITRLTTRDGVASDYGGPLFESRDGTLWVGTAHGLTRIRNGTVTSYTTGLLSGAVSAIFEDEEGLVVAPSFAGLHRFRDGRLTPYRVAGSEGFRSYYIFQAHRSEDGTVWLAANKGLVCIRNGAARIFNGANGLLEDSVRAIYEDAGALWIATAKVGLARYASGRFLTITARQGLFDDRVYSVLPANDGCLWMSSPRGLFRVSREDIESLAAGNARQRAVDRLRRRRRPAHDRLSGWRATSGLQVTRRPALVRNAEGRGRGRHHPRQPESPAATGGDRRPRSRRTRDPGAGSDRGRARGAPRRVPLHRPQPAGPPARALPLSAGGRRPGLAGGPSALGRLHEPAPRPVHLSGDGEQQRRGLERHACLARPRCPALLLPDGAGSGCCSRERPCSPRLPSTAGG